MAALRKFPDIGDEAARVRALERYEVLGTPREGHFDRITDIVCDLLDVPICAISLVAAETVWVKAIRGLDPSEYAREEALCDHTIRQRNILLVPDAARDPRFADHPAVLGDPFVGSYVGAPLVSPDGYNVGALCAVDYRPRDFSPRECQLIERFARLVVDQLELRTIAHHDFLTGVLTRRAFIEAAETALRLRERRSEPLALLMFDIDHFKQVNDRFGHAGGDAVIKLVASECERLLRPGDCIGRLGGEEFGILLTGADQATALACAERLRKAIAALTPPGAEPVTASFGVASAHCGSEVGDWLAAADAALYAAKRGGRNCCFWADETSAQAA